MTQPLKAVIAKFEALHDKKKALEEELKLLNEEYDQVRQVEMLEAMERAGLLDKNGKGSCTTESGRKVYVTTDTRAYIRKEDEEEAFTAIRDMGYGELIKETIHHMTLTSWIKTRLEEGEETPPGVQMYTQPKAVLRSN